MNLATKPKKVLAVNVPLALIFLGLQILIILLAWRYLPPQIPLFYSRPWGQEQLVDPLMIFVLPGLSLATIVVNSFLNSIVGKEEVLIRRVLTTTASLFSFLSLVTLVQIIRLVI
jgi:hypothetical protein